MPFEKLRESGRPIPVVVCRHLRSDYVYGRLRSVCGQDQISAQQAITYLPRGPVFPRDFVPDGVYVEEVGGVVDPNGPVGLHEMRRGGNVHGGHRLRDYAKQLRPFAPSPCSANSVVQASLECRFLGGQERVNAYGRREPVLEICVADGPHLIEFAFGIVPEVFTPEGGIGHDSLPVRLLHSHEARHVVNGGWLEIPAAFDVLVGVSSDASHAILVARLFLGLLAVDPFGQ